jgi:hypothetical protein
MHETPVGETFIFENKTYVVVETEIVCQDCAFKEDRKLGKRCPPECCLLCHRRDKLNVVFKEVHL